ncbi:hypothetical protein B9Z55_022592 [Caenorhabditis nigoni]|uniref:Uncharacterized protein n=1 Tax=Caenorhabditis nigoni TaxID=1611254 RepID=A0A2G5SKZ8_9PELO|nr:hypothetical protein B9Z55_022592 [Caenorhabditis nigoni]
MFFKLLLVFLVVPVSLVCNAPVETNFVAANSSKLKFLHNFEDVARALVDCSADKKGIIIGYYPINSSTATALDMGDIFNRYSNAFDVYFQSGDQEYWTFTVYGKAKAKNSRTISFLQAETLDNHIKYISSW